MSKTRTHMTALTRIKLWFLGPRDHPEGVVTLPEHMVRDFPSLLEQARKLNPAVSVESVVYTIWRLGSRRLEQNLVRHIPVRVSELPHAAAPNEARDAPPAGAAHARHPSRPGAV